jgi:hypothetical protein
MILKEHVELVEAEWFFVDIGGGDVPVSDGPSRTAESGRNDRQERVWRTSL